jgi:uncharacterized protein (TIGR02996 family)
MNDDNHFVQAILASPDDANLRLVYADWLEERGDPRAEFLRTEAELADLPGDHRRARRLQARMRKLRTDINADWLALFDRTAIEGCFRFDYVCPKRWEKLTPTEHSRIRFCEACSKKVFYCATVEHAQRHANFGHCVTVDSRLPRAEGDLYTSPSRDPHPNPHYHTLMVAGGPRRPAPRFCIGQRVRFRSGPHRESEGRITRLSLIELRATILMDPSGDQNRPGEHVVEADFEDLDPR